jgi:hyperosmotically inducible periplasmic protein
MNNFSIRHKSVGLAIVLIVLAAGIPDFAQKDQSKPLGDSITREVRHVLVQVPYFSVFDNLEYSVNGSVVTLTGQVTFDSVKHEAVNAVKAIEGVTDVRDNITVLPASGMDDQIRRATYRAIYGDPSLQRYAQGVIQPIHIIVDQGHVTLEGVVDNESDRNLANIRANGVPGVFSVTNNLKVAPKS